MAKITHSGNEGAEVHFELRELSSHVMRLIPDCLDINV